MKELLVKLNQINKIPYVNRGGCAIVSLAIQRYLKNKNIKSKIVFSHYYKDETMGSLRPCNHSYIKIKKHFYDSKGIYDKVQYHKRTINDEYELIQCINDVYGWNNSFNRTKYVPKIEKILDVDLSDVLI